MQVMHPRVKRYIRHVNAKVLILDRVGLAMVNKLQRATGARPISSFLSPVDRSQLGHVGRITEVSVDKKSYICLTGCQQQHSTLVLYCLTEQSANELKSLCNTALRVLQQASAVPVALVAAGTWQRHLASYLLENVGSKSVEYSRLVDCTKYDAVLGVKCIANCLQHVGMLMDRQTADGSYTGLLDHIQPSVDSLHSAFALTRSILNIGRYLHCSAG